MSTYTPSTYAKRLVYQIDEPVPFSVYDYSNYSFAIEIPQGSAEITEWAMSNGGIPNAKLTDDKGQTFFGTVFKKADAACVAAVANYINVDVEEFKLDLEIKTKAASPKPLVKPSVVPKVAAQQPVVADSRLEPAKLLQTEAIPVELALKRLLLALATGELEGLAWRMPFTQDSQKYTGNVTHEEGVLRLELV